MNLWNLFIGALTLRTETYVQLRERSDTFLRGFLVLAVAGVIAGAFVATEMLVTQLALPSKDAAVAQVQAGMAQAQIPPAFRGMAEAYVLNAVSMVYELEHLPPQAGAWATPLATGLDWLGATLRTPFNFGYVGWTVVGGLLFGGVALWFGGRGDLNKMLGLTALAAAPQVFNALIVLLTTLATLTGISALTGLNGLLGLGIALWSAVIYVKATAIAQNFSVGRAVASIALGLAILVGLVVALIVLLVLVIGWLVSALR